MNKKEEGIQRLFYMSQPDHRFPLDDLDTTGQILIDRSAPDVYDLYDLAHVAGWGAYGLHDLADAFGIRSALQGRFCTASDNGR